MIIILLGLLLLIGIYYYMQQKKEASAPILEPFVASDEFTGAKKGYVFKMDSHGLGYYLDR